MRLLLLLSAILSALTGVAGARAAIAPQVVSASAGRQMARTQVAASEIARSFAPAPQTRTVVVLGVSLMALTLRRAYPLYADRPRE